MRASSRPSRPGAGASFAVVAVAQMRVGSAVWEAGREDLGSEERQSAAC